MNQFQHEDVTVVERERQRLGKILNDLFGIPIKIRFTVDDLDEKHLNWVEEASTKIAKGVLNAPSQYSKSYAGKQRTFEEIKSDARNGVIAEAMLLQDYAFTEDLRKFHDVIACTKNELEIKSWFADVPATRYNHIFKLEKKKTKYPHVVMFKRSDGEYTFESYWTFDYDKQQYKEEFCQPQSTILFQT
jgi:hypothetical protein